MAAKTIEVPPSTSVVGLRFEFSPIRAGWEALYASATARRTFGTGTTADEIVPEEAMFAASVLDDGEKTVLWNTDLYAPNQQTEVRVEVWLTLDGKVQGDEPIDLYEATLGANEYDFYGGYIRVRRGDA